MAIPPITEVPSTWRCPRKWVKLSHPARTVTVMTFWDDQPPPPATVEGPTYQSDLVTIYRGDVADIAPTLARSSVDLIAVDPPYGQQWRSNRRTEKFDHIANDEGTYDVAAAIGSCLPALARGRHVYIFGPADLASLPLTESAELIWDKGILGMGDLASPWGPQHEPITFATYEISKANRQKGYGRLAARLRRGSIIAVQRPHSGGVKRHPTEKPVALMRQLIESSTVAGERLSSIRSPGPARHSSPPSSPDAGRSASRSTMATAPLPSPGARRPRRSSPTWSDCRTPITLRYVNP